jgi:hypothetical protein
LLCTTFCFADQLGGAAFAGIAARTDKQVVAKARLVALFNSMTITYGGRLPQQMVVPSRTSVQSSGVSASSRDASHVEKPNPALILITAQDIPSRSVQAIA